MISEDEFDEEEIALYQHFQFTTDKKQSPIRIDKFLMDRIPNASRNKIQDAIKLDFILVNGKPIKANYKVRPEEVITVSLPNPPRNEELVGEDIPLNIIYEDDDLLIVNKEAGMVVHPAHGNWNGTLVNALVHHFDNLPTSMNGSIRPGLVHRIDKDTSGLLVIAKNEEAMTHLGKQFYDHSIERKYLALVWGEPIINDSKDLESPEGTGTIEGHIGRSLKNRKVMDVFEDGSFGKHAVTHYRILKSLRYISLIECELETGRTHQIRAHLQHIGNPLFGDTTYGGDRVVKGTVFSKYKAFVENCFKMLPRQALHAKSLGFIHPRTNERMYFESELPEDMQAVIQKWENYIHFT